MNENCLNCPFKKDLDDLKVIVRDHEKEIANLNKISAVSKEQIEMIFKIVKEIKDSVNSLGDSIKEIQKEITSKIKEGNPAEINGLKDQVKALESKVSNITMKPLETYEKIKIAVITAAATFGAIELIKYILK